jgi:hypothetical protein
MVEVGKWQPSLSRLAHGSLTVTVLLALLLVGVQMMAVLSEALLYCTSGPLRMQALSAWLCFVQLLARHAPKVLERIAAQAAVVLLPVLEPADSQVDDNYRAR